LAGETRQRWWFIFRKWTSPALRTTFNCVKIFLSICCFVGVVVPYYFAIPFFLAHGLDLRLFVQEIFANHISSFFAADLILSSIIFLSWSRRDAREKSIEGWWQVLAANLVVGLSLALPLYFLKRLAR
jgi:hypothetical protein